MHPEDINDLVWVADAALDPTGERVAYAVARVDGDAKVAGRDLFGADDAPADAQGCPGGQRRPARGSHPPGRRRADRLPAVPTQTRSCRT